MITLEELNTVKEKRKTTLYYEEKEYLQYIFLNALTKYDDHFIFKGGTCLRICYGLERASEDLDFSTLLSVKEIREKVYVCLKEFTLLNINYKPYAEKEYHGNLRIEVRFEGPLFVGKQSSSNTLKLDFNKGMIKNKVAKVVQKLFSDVPLFTLVVADEKEILAEKIRALLNRGEPRDVYDLWMLLSKKVSLDEKLIAEKLREEKSDLGKIQFPSKEEYLRDLKNLVHYIPPYEQVKKEVIETLTQLKNRL